MYPGSRLAWCITLFVLVWATAPADAAVIIVTSDSGGIGGSDCTLRDAITAASTTPC